MAIEKVKLTSESASATQSKLNDNFEYLDLNKVDVDGSKVLSDNNYDDNSKEKLDNLPIYSTSTPDTRVFLGGTCSTASTTSLKSVTMSKYDELKVGDIVEVKFDNASFDSAILNQLKVNNTDAKYVRRRTTNSSLVSATWEANDVLKFRYDGTYWVMFEKNGKNDYSTTSGIANDLTYGIKLQVNNSSTNTWHATSDVQLSNYYTDLFTDQTIGGVLHFTHKGAAHIWRGEQDSNPRGLSP